MGFNLGDISLITAEPDIHPISLRLLKPTRSEPDDYLLAVGIDFSHHPDLACALLLIALIDA